MYIKDLKPTKLKSPLGGQQRLLIHPAGSHSPAKISRQGCKLAEEPPSPCLPCCYGSGNHDTSGQAEWAHNGTRGPQREEVHQPSDSLRTRKVLTRGVSACPSRGVEEGWFPLPLPWREVSLSWDASPGFWGGGGEVFWSPAVAVRCCFTNTSMFPCCSHFCCSPPPFSLSARR